MSEFTDCGGGGDHHGHSHGHYGGESMSHGLAVMDKHGHHHHSGYSAHNQSQETCFDASDHGIHDGHHGHASPGFANSANNTFTWSSVMKQGLNWSNLTSGMRVTPNMLFLGLFVGMGVWLFVVYSIRHNDPLARQSAMHQAIRSDHPDAALVDRIYNATPIRFKKPAATQDSASTGQAFSGSTQTFAAQPFSAQQSAPKKQVVNETYPYMPQASGSTWSPNTQQQASSQSYSGYSLSQPNAVSVPVITAGGTKVKVYTNR